MSNLNLIFILVAIGVSIMIAVAAMSGTNKTNLSIEELKLTKGEISVFQYCSHIGKAAIDDDKCEDFNLVYGPQS
jgi:hypothetical protein